MAFSMQGLRRGGVSKCCLVGVRRWFTIGVG
ncbi:hypothetical protein RHECNPAF_1740040 [Rhizobium etli CNPAF512]|nr:hypothetical protein RHECNPAF_1740040 [Rhizobium etli CNPAF512]